MHKFSRKLIERIEKSGKFSSYVNLGVGCYLDINVADLPETKYFVYCGSHERFSGPGVVCNRFFDFTRQGPINRAKKVMGEVEKYFKDKGVKVETMEDIVEDKEMSNIAWKMLQSEFPRLKRRPIV